MHIGIWLAIFERAIIGKTGHSQYSLNICANDSRSVTSLILNVGYSEVRDYYAGSEFKGSL